MTLLTPGPPAPSSGPQGDGESTVHSPEWSESPGECRTLSNEGKVWPWTGSTRCQLSDEGGPSACQSPPTNKQVEPGDSAATSSLPALPPILTLPCPLSLSQTPAVSKTGTHMLAIFPCSGTMGCMVCLSSEQLMHMPGRER